jgi:hypothetical protein
MEGGTRVQTEVQTQRNFHQSLNHHILNNNEGLKMDFYFILFSLVDI